MFNIKTKNMSTFIYFSNNSKSKYRSKIRSKWQCVSTIGKGSVFINLFDIFIIVSRNITEVRKLSQYSKLFSFEVDRCRWLLYNNFDLIKEKNMETYDSQQSSNSEGMNEWDSCDGVRTDSNWRLVEE
jgi:hypothetical protein